MSTEAAPRRPRLDPDERRREILACAVRLFGERPYAAVSTEDIAREAGVTRTLIHHYFGTKRELYLEVVRELLYVPPLEQITLPTGTVRERIDSSVAWLLNIVEAHGKSWVAVSGAEGNADEDVQRLLDEADDLAAQRLLDILGLSVRGRRAALIATSVRAFGGLSKAAIREWVVRGNFTRKQVHVLLSDVLVTIVETSVPRM